MNNIHRAAQNLRLQGLHLLDHHASLVQHWRPVPQAKYKAGPTDLLLGDDVISRWQQNIPSYLFLEKKKMLRKSA